MSRFAIVGFSVLCLVIVARAEQPITPDRTIKTPDPVRTLAVAPDGKTLAACSGRITFIFDVASGEQLSKVVKHENDICLVRYTADARLLTASEDGVARLWNPAAPEKDLQVFRSDSPIMLARLSRDGKVLATAGQQITVWDVMKEKQISRFGSKRVQCLAISPDGKKIAAALEFEMSVHVYDASGKELGTVDVGQPFSKGLNISPDGRWVEMTVNPWTPTFWSLGSLAPGAKVNVEGAGDSTFSPDGSLLAGGTWPAREPETVWIYKLSIHKVVATLGPAQQPFNQVVFSPDGKTLFGVTANQSGIMVWNLAKVPALQ